MRATMLLLISLTAWSSPVAGQVAPRSLAASVLSRDLPRGPLSVGWSLTPSDTLVRDIRPTYWKEGAAVGGLAGAVGGALVGLWACGMSDEVGKDCTGTAIGGGVGGAVLLAIPGALIGGQFEKGSDGDDSPSN
jgi:hypothetical protein